MKRHATFTIVATIVLLNSACQLIYPFDERKTFGAGGAGGGRSGSSGSKTDVSSAGNGTAATNATAGGVANIASSSNGGVAGSSPGVLTGIGGVGGIGAVAKSTPGGNTSTAVASLGGAPTATSQSGAGGMASATGGATTTLGGATTTLGGATALGGTSPSSNSAAGAGTMSGGAAPTGGVGNGGTTAGIGGASTAATGGIVTGGTVATGGTTAAATGGNGTAEVPTGNPTGGCTIPTDAQVEDTSSPNHVVGNGTPASCTGAEFVKQVALGGVITFNCGPDPITIKLDQTAKIFNDKGPKIVIDGGGKVTLSGQNKVRVLYQNTCDVNQVFTTNHCQDQDHPQLTVQNLTFIEGNSKSDTEFTGGGAIWARGGRLKVINSRFFNNACAEVGPDIEGGAIFAMNNSYEYPVYVVNSTFGGRSDLGNACSNGGALGSIQAPWTVINSLFRYNTATGNGGSPAVGGPGGGLGGTIFIDGTNLNVSLCGSIIEQSVANTMGGAIFMVEFPSVVATLKIQNSILRYNRGGSSEALPGIYMPATTTRTITGSMILQ